MQRRDSDATGSAWSRGTRLAALTAATSLAVVAPASAAMAAGGTTTGADVQVAGSASTGSPSPGTAYSYTFQVKNTGPDAATSLTFNDPLPAGTVYNYATANGSTLPCAAFGNLSGGATVSCNLGNLAKGGQATVVVNVNAPTTASTYSNTGSATSTATDPQPANNSSTVTVQVKAAAGGGGGGGGGGTGGGGVNAGGVNDTAPATATPCAALGNLAAPVGYYLTWAAIWNTFTVRSCSSSVETVNVEVTETNAATGLVDYDVVIPFSLVAAQNASMVLDNDFAPFNTTYTVAFTATDATTGTVLATSSLVTTTPPPQ